jgi:AcrR family transcriptional regulator
MVYESKAAERRDKLRDALIDAAEQTIATEGLRALRARDLAAQVGCAVGAIYNAVADLDELIYAVNARTLAALEQTFTEAGAVGAAAPSADSAIAQFVRLALAYTDFADANRPRWRALFGHQPPVGREVPMSYMEDQLRLFSYVEKPLRVLMPATTRERRTLLARSLFSAVHGIVVLGLEERLQLFPLPVLREQVIFLVEAMGRGLMQNDAK